MIPTAEEMANGMFGKDCYPTDTTYCMIEFAKLHVEAALKAAHANMQLPKEDLEFTLQSYPLENIK